MTEYREGRRVLRRTAARVVLIAGGTHTLLVHGRNPHQPAAGSWWFTPGGGCEPDESLAAAARRELYEETGIADLTLGPVVWTRSVAHPYLKDQFLCQEEHYFVGFTDSRQLRQVAWTDEERRQLLGMRWWDADELAATTETILPPILPRSLPRLIAGDYPPSPVHLDR
ncbi:NUDIX domain-containing protein [Streptomyces sp. DSM 44915]|uniref:NUDIX domain-containing protein n=1 Tax=Streptomyces chisholmiae TaxID=3075540 RepID=A0ABU2JUJ3_9ACTN|nr:NUDIX domain-containing protein [Streptomyces sp. DSM 44915]MDT0268649.1 NUDIX domain-containing protein [Streptomyces sp. DSM 44915]